MQGVGERVGGMASIAGLRLARIERMRAAAIKARDQAQPDSERLDRRIAALDRLARAPGQPWARVRWSRGLLQWRADQLRRWKVPYGLRILATIPAAVVGLARWEALHAEDGYCEPPANVWRCGRLWRQARWGPIGTAILAAAGAFATWVFVLRPTFPERDADLAVLAAAIWLMVLSLPGELPLSVRGRVRCVLWAIEFVLWLAFDQTGGQGNGVVLHGSASAVVDGVRYSAIADLIGLAILAVLVWARDWPLRAMAAAEAPLVAAPAEPPVVR